jgi:hypothetical protein
LVLAGMACNNGAQKREIEAAASAAAEKAVAEERSRVAAAEAEKARSIEHEKERVVKEPSSYLEAKDVEVFDRGILRRYREVVKLSVINKAKWPVQNMTGNVDWVDASGNTLASVILVLKGSIPAGATQTFSKQEGTLATTTIQLAAPTYRIRFSKVALVEAP